MEGSADRRHVGNYDELSLFYDELLQDEEAYGLWLQYIEEKPFHTLLELASGSAVLTGILEKKGYEILASDLSERMREASKKNYSGEYVLLDMRDFSLGKTFDTVICVVDSINYLTFEELPSCFISVYWHLNPGGRFLFDMHHPARLKEFEDEYIEEGTVSGVPYQWTIRSVPEDAALHEHFTFYTPEGIVQEQHLQHVFDAGEVKKLMERVGFSVRVIEDFVEDEKILMIGEKL